MIVKNEKFKQSILSALADPETLDILNICMHKAISFVEIVKETDIPHTTAYRKIKSLVDEGLMIVEKFNITDDGKKFSLFRSLLRTIDVKYESSTITISTEKNVDAVEKTAERFFSLD